MNYHEKAEELLKCYVKVFRNPGRESLISDSVETKTAMTLPTGTLVTWTPTESTGRSPKDTYIVRHTAGAGTVDWDSPNNIPLEPESFEMLAQDAFAALDSKKRLYALDRVVGADTSYALPVLTITDNALSGLFVDNMFRKVPEDIETSAFHTKPFLLLALPYEKLDPARYKGRLREMPGGSTSDMAVAMDFDNRIGIVFGSAYMGSIKKLIFTVMNYYLPELGILPLHCSANEGPDGSSALLLGLSGTGKTTLSADPQRALIGDDEHGWSKNGVANFENGCYAKLINLNPEKEPEIFRAAFHADHYLSHGSIVENVMVYPDGTFDLDDDRFTPNSRVSYPLRYLSNIKLSATTGHPTTILFLTADAYGVLPPVSKLSSDQAKLWFMMGYTSKLAGTETGITEPQATFSRFFGQPFMPRNPRDYTDLLEEYTSTYKTNVFLINTGWSGGPFGVGSRIDINVTRAMVRAALNGSLDSVEYSEDPVFKVQIPGSCPGVDSTLLVPKNTWKDKNDFDKTAQKLATQFKNYFDKAFAGKVSDDIAAQCPGV